MDKRRRRVLRTAGTWGLALLPALLWGLYARWPSAAFLSYGMLVPWVLLYTDDRRPKVSLVYFVAGAYATWMLSYPQTFRYGWIPPFLIGLIYLPPRLLLVPVLRRVHRRLRLPRAVSVPLLWVTAEWVRVTLSLAHIDFYPLGYSQARFVPLVQMAEWTGMYGLSFLVAAVNGWIADAWFAIRDAGGSWRGLAVRRVWMGACALLASFALLSGYGLFRLNRIEERDGPRLAIVQPNILHTMQNAVGVHLTQVVITDREIAPGEADLIVWPENAILDHIRREGAYLDDLRWLAQRKEAWMLVGALDAVEGRPGRTTNTAYLLDESGAIRGTYDKQVLFPWGEYVPLDDWLGKLSPALQRAHRTIVRQAWGFLATGTPGAETTLLRLPWNGETVPFGTLICNENTYSPIPAEAGRRGARFFLNITSEGEVGGPVQEQLLRICILRAVENRISYVRVGNTGISCVIDSAGRVRSVLRGRRGRTISDDGVLVESVPLASSGTTFYARSRELFPKVCALASLVLLVWSWIGRGRTALGTVGALLLFGGVSCGGVPRLADGPVANAAESYEEGKRLFKSGVGNCAAAMERFAEACADPALCGRALRYAAECYRETRRFEIGEEFFRRVGERHADLLARTDGYRGFFLDRGGQPSAALELYRRSLAREPSAQVYHWQGLVQARLGDPAAAVESFRSGLALTPEDPQLRYLLGRALRLVGRLDEARAELEAVVARKLDHGPAWVNLGRVRLAQGEDEAAVSAFRRALEVEPRNVEARFMLARRALRKEESDVVARLLREILEIEAGLGRGPREQQ